MKRGYTLVEVLVTAAILGIMVLMIIGVVQNTDTAQQQQIELVAEVEQPQQVRVKQANNEAAVFNAIITGLICSGVGFGGGYAVGKRR